MQHPTHCNLRAASTRRLKPARKSMRASGSAQVSGDRLIRSVRWHCGSRLRAQPLAQMCRWQCACEPTRNQDGSDQQRGTHHAGPFWAEQIARLANQENLSMMSPRARSASESRQSRASRRQRRRDLENAPSGPHARILREMLSRAAELMRRQCKARRIIGIASPSDTRLLSSRPKRSKPTMATNARNSTPFLTDPLWPQTREIPHLC